MAIRKINSTFPGAAPAGDPNDGGGGGRGFHRGGFGAAGEDPDRVPDAVEHEDPDKQEGGVLPGDEGPQGGDHGERPRGGASVGVREGEGGADAKGEAAAADDGFKDPHSCSFLLIDTSRRLQSFEGIDC